MRFQHVSSTSLAIPLIVEEYVFDYFAHIFVVALLSLITIFRREMSCNSVYLGVDKTPSQSRKQSDAKLQDPNLSNVQEGGHSLKFNQNSSNKRSHQLERSRLPHGIYLGELPSSGDCKQSSLRKVDYEDVRPQ